MRRRRRRPLRAAQTSGSGSRALAGRPSRAAGGGGGRTGEADRGAGGVEAVVEEGVARAHRVALHRPHQPPAPQPPLLPETPSRRGTAAAARTCRNEHVPQCARCRNNHRVRYRRARYRRGYTAPFLGPLSQRISGGVTSQRLTVSAPGTGAPPPPRPPLPPRTPVLPPPPRRPVPGPCPRRWRARAPPARRGPRRGGTGAGAPRRAGTRTAAPRGWGGFCSRECRLAARHAPGCASERGSRAGARR